MKMAPRCAHRPIMLQTVVIMFSLRVDLHQFPLTVPLTVGIGRRKFDKLLLSHCSENKKKNKKRYR